MLEIPCCFHVQGKSFRTLDIVARSSLKTVATALTQNLTCSHECQYSRGYKGPLRECSSRMVLRGFSVRGGSVCVFGFLPEGHQRQNPVREVFKSARPISGLERYRRTQRIKRRWERHIPRDVPYRSRHLLVPHQTRR